MRLLLDSQAFVYMVRSPEALPPVALAAIEEPGNELFLSIVTPIELQIKVNIGKLKFVRPITEAVQREVDRGTLALLPVTLRHVDALARLPDHHRDPFDRLLVAQAMHDNLTLVTGDATITRYPVPTLWR